MDNSDKKIFALVDCNNFYASCERVFSPGLINRPGDTIQQRRMRCGFIQRGQGFGYESGDPHIQGKTARPKA